MRDFGLLRLPVALALIGAGLSIASPCGAQPAPASPATQGAAPSASTTTPSPSTVAPGSAAPPPTALPLPTALDALGWLRGCWLGSANRREFFEQWSPPRGRMMVGISHTVVAPKFQGTVREKMEAAGKMNADPSKDKTQDFEYLRLEQRDDGIYYVGVPAGKKEIVFRLTSLGEDSGSSIFTFTNLADEFPRYLIYRRGTEGWLYAQVTNKPGVAGSDVVYPMRHIDCATEAFLKE